MVTWRTDKNIERRTEHTIVSYVRIRSYGNNRQGTISTNATHVLNRQYASTSHIILFW